MPKMSSMEMTVCECNHLTTFGSFFVKPNDLKPLSLTMLKENYVMLVTVATILLLYGIGLIFTRRADREDCAKVLKQLYFAIRDVVLTSLNDTI